MIKILVPRIWLWMCLSTSIYAANRSPQFFVPPDFRGLIFMIGSPSVSQKLQGRIEIDRRGIVVCSTLEPIKHKTLPDLKFRFKNADRVIAPGDADTTDDEIHVWNVALGSGPVDGQYMEYIVVFIGTAERRRRLLNTKIDLDVISKLLKAARTEQKSE